MIKRKYKNIKVINGSLTILVYDKKGKAIGTTDILLENVDIKVPNLEFFGVRPEIKDFSGVTIQEGI